MNNNSFNQWLHEQPDGTLMGMPMQVYRHIHTPKIMAGGVRHSRTLSHDCSAGGLSSFHNTVTLVGPDVFPLFEADEGSPPVFLVTRDLGNGPIYHVEPVLPEDEAGPLMFGGCFVYSSDGRVRRGAPGFHGAFALHDRMEK